MKTIVAILIILVVVVSFVSADDDSTGLTEVGDFFKKIWAFISTFVTTWSLPKAILAYNGGITGTIGEIIGTND